MPRRLSLSELGGRLERLESSTLQIANWLAAQPQIEAVFHSAPPSCPGHATWRRDFTGSASVFSILFHYGIDPSQVRLRIPIQSGRGFRFDPGHHSDLMPAAIPK
jgi:cystathionine beta-lyase/cystathionine gamma-synthase